MRRGCIYRKLLTDLRRLSDEIPTDIKKSVGIPSELSNPKRLYNGHMYLSATVTWFVGIPSENTDGIPTTLLLIGMSSEFRRNIPTNFRRLQRFTFSAFHTIVQSPFVVELWKGLALREAITNCNELGLREVCFGSDSTQLINAINEGKILVEIYEVYMHVLKGAFEQSDVNVCPFA
ncbi:hypothetical protein YC2023_012691 [Brassica napus]